MADGLAPSRIVGDPGLPFGAFITFIASIMALNSLGIDSMLPALPEIGRTLHVASENERQWVIVTFMLGFGVAQIVWGPLADRFGRKPILVAGLSLYAVFAVVAAFASSFPLLLGARLLQGIASSSSRVLVVSMVRDCYSGRRMARVMSLSFMVFIAVPMIAPSVGQLLIALFGSWQSIFFFIGGYAAIVAVVSALFLRETLHPEYRRPLTFASVFSAIGRVLTTRVSIGYAVAAAFCFGCMTGFISSVQQIFVDRYHQVTLFPLMFASIASGLAISAFVNSRLVERHGTRRISHSAMFGFVALSTTHLVLAWNGLDGLGVFMAVQLCQMFCFGLMTSNFNSMAMEPMGDIAGAAASVQGFISTIIGALLGSVIGQSFDGTTMPLSLGFSLLGAMIVLTVLWTERGRLFRPHYAPPIKAG